MEPVGAIGGIAHVIQIAVAPVFLLTGIAGILSVLSLRLGRITDRARVLEQRIPQIYESKQRDWLRSHGDLLWRRMRMINWAIRLSVGGALLVCLVVVALFVDDGWVVDIGPLIAAMFVVAMLLVIGGLLLLLIEVSLSTRRTREELEAFLAGATYGREGGSNDSSRSGEAG